MHDNNWLNKYGSFSKIIANAKTVLKSYALNLLMNSSQPIEINKQEAIKTTKIKYLRNDLHIYSIKITYLMS
jgi:hypothetical protein